MSTCLKTDFKKVIKKLFKKSEIVPLRFYVIYIHTRHTHKRKVNIIMQTMQWCTKTNKQNKKIPTNTNRTELSHSQTNHSRASEKGQQYS